MQWVLALIALVAVVGVNYASAGHHHHAHSYANFHGPVHGPDHEVSVHSKHGHHVDYVAHPKYEFHYGVEDHHTGDFHGQKEHRDGEYIEIFAKIIFSHRKFLTSSR